MSKMKDEVNASGGTESLPLAPDTDIDVDISKMFDSKVADLLSKKEAELSKKEAEIAKLKETLDAKESLFDNMVKSIASGAGTQQQSKLISQTTEYIELEIVSNPGEPDPKKHVKTKVKEAVYNIVIDLPAGVDQLRVNRMSLRNGMVCKAVKSMAMSILEMMYRLQEQEEINRGNHTTADTVWRRQQRVLVEGAKTPQREQEVINMVTGYLPAL